MKKIILIIICILCINVKASVNVTYNKAKEVANNYIDRNMEHSFYFLNNTDYYGFNSSNKIYINNDFKKGGLLNLQEYKISLYENNTYLNSGANYWTMTNSSNKYYVINEQGSLLKDESSLNQVRITQYVKKDTIVQGSGSYANPWKFRKTYTIIIASTDDNKGTNSPTKTIAYEGASVAIGVYPKTGYTYDKNNCNLSEISDNGIVIRDIKEDYNCLVDFKAQKYTLTYDTKGGSSCSNKEITYAEKYGDLCVTTKTGYTFEKWVDKDNNEITKDSIVKDGEKLTAIWNPINYEIRFNANTGSGTMNNLAMIYDVTKELTENKYTKEGYTFDGWNTKADGSDTSFVDKQKVNNLMRVEGIFDLYAKWKANTYTIALNGNGATTAGTTSVIATYNSNTISPSTITLPQKSYTVTYNGNSQGATYTPNSETAVYTFDGWYSAASGGSKVLNANTTASWVASVDGYTDSNKKWIKVGGATLYARWSKGSITLPSITKTGYTCKWAEGSKSGTQYDGGTSRTITENTTYYAVCTANSVTCYKSYDKCPSGYNLETNGCFTYTSRSCTQYSESFTDWTCSHLWGGTSVGNYCCLSCPSSYPYTSGLYCAAKADKSECTEGDKINGRCEKTFEQETCPSGWTKK